MTDQTTVTVDATPAAGLAWVTAKLIAGGAGATLDGELVVGTRTTRLDADGTGSLDLEPNEAMSPAGTYWSLSVAVAGESVIRCLNVPETGDPVSWADAEIQVLAPSPPSVYPAPTPDAVGQFLTPNAEGNRVVWGDPPEGGGDTGTVLVDLLVGEVDLEGGSFTEVPLHNGGSVPRQFLAGITAAALEGSSVGRVYTLTASGPCTPGAALTLGQIVTSKYLGLSAQASGTFGNPNVLALTVNQTEATDLTLRTSETDRQVALADIVEETIAYLKIGRSGAGAHADGAFVCDTVHQFPNGLDLRYQGRLIRTAGPGTFAEQATISADSLVGAKDKYEGAIFEDEDEDLRWFGEHIMTGQTEEQDPRAISDAGSPDNPKRGVPFSWRHTISYTGGTGGNGVETIYVESADGATLTADGRRWRAVHTVQHDHPESVTASFPEPIYLGLSDHETHLYVFQAFNGIDTDQLVDLHASDATSATEVTCRLGNVFTAAGDQGEIVNFRSGGGAVASVNGQTGTVVLDAADVGAATAADIDEAVDALGPLATATPVRPSGDLTCTSTAVLANWTGFAIPVVAGNTYDFDGIAFYSGDSNADARFGCTAPAGTLRVAGAGLGASSSSLPGGVQTSDVIDASGEYLKLGCVSSTRQAVAFAGTFACTTDGTLQFQGAQDISNLTPTVFQAFGTRLTYTARPT